MTLTFSTIGQPTISIYRDGQQIDIRIPRNEHPSTITWTSARRERATTRSFGNDRRMFSANDTQVSTMRQRERRDWRIVKGLPRTIRASNSSQRKQRQHGVSARSPMQRPARPPIHNGGIVPLTSNRSLVVHSPVMVTSRSSWPTSL